jgi:hypothetical protein
MPVVGLELLSQHPAGIPLPSLGEDLLERIVVLRFVEHGRPGMASVQGVINPTRFVCTLWSSHLGIFSELNSPEKSPDTFSSERDAGKYEGIAGFCKSASLEEIESHGHVLTPGRYVGAEETEDDDDMPYDERMEQLTAKLKGQFAESSKLEKTILKNLARLGFTGKGSP